jgi:hypothetical protein
MTYTNFLRPIQSLCFTTLITLGAVNQASAAITPARDAFPTTVGGGTLAGANGDFGGLRREIN